MAQSDWQAVVDQYVAWLRAGIEVTDSEQGVCEITTPFLDTHNDHIAIFAQRIGDHILLTDDGVTITDLEMIGVDLKLDTRQEMLNTILRAHGVHRAQDRIEVEARDANVGKRMHSLLQAMLSVGDMRSTSRQSVLSLFVEEVRGFLDLGEVRFSRHVKLTGKSGFDHLVDFLIPKSKARPERVIQAIASPDKQAVTRYLWALTDTIENRDEDSQPYAVLDDRKDEVDPELTEALTTYNVRIAKWSTRNDWLQELAA